MNHQDNKRPNNTDAGNGSKAICRVSNVLRSPSPDPRRSANIGQPAVIDSMNTPDLRLTDAPDDYRSRELWLQHAIGHILFRDVRDYALRQLDPLLSPEAKAAATKAANDALYGLMMILDGVTGSLENDSSRVSLRVIAELTTKENSEVVHSVDLFNGDGMCMGYHGWQEGDFGEIPPFA